MLNAERHQLASPAVGIDATLASDAAHPAATVVSRGMGAPTPLIGPRFQERRPRM